MTGLPGYYFRVRDNGAIVFRINAENRQRRIEMDQIAIINTNRGDYKPHGSYSLTPEDKVAIQGWLDTRLGVLEMRELDDMKRVVDQMNIATQWVQSKASDDQIESITDDLLLAMHDLRSVLVRKKADRMVKPDTA